jgi:hypothetical protein
VLCVAEIGIQKVILEGDAEAVIEAANRNQTHLKRFHPSIWWQVSLQMCSRCCQNEHGSRRDKGTKGPKWES